MIAVTITKTDRKKKVYLAYNRTTKLNVKFIQQYYTYVQNQCFLGKNYPRQESSIFKNVDMKAINAIYISFRTLVQINILNEYNDITLSDFRHRVIALPHC
jgi:hypothetical protein